jgi:hypothetical protein
MFMHLIFISIYTCFEYTSKPYTNPNYYEDSDKSDSGSVESSISDERALHERVVPFSRSITHGKLMTNPSNFVEVIGHEFDDVGKDLKTRLTGQIENARGTVYDKERFKQVFFIKKHIVSDGFKKVVNINIKEKIVPRENISVDKTDYGVVSLLACIAFLLLGLVFTTSMKLWENFLKPNKYAPKL